MKSKIKIRYRELVFLFVYLRHLEMSLDRARWEGFYDLRLYYHTQLSPQEVANWSFWEPMRIGEASNDFDTNTIPKYSVLQKLSLRIVSFFGYYCIDKFLKSFYLGILRDFDSLLKGDELTYTEKHERLRQKIVRLAYHRLRYLLRSKDLSSAYMVEHYLQAEYLEHIPVRYYWAKILL